MDIIAPEGITGPPCSGGGAGSGLGIGIGIGIGEFVGMTGGPWPGVVGPAKGGGAGAYCASGMDIVGAINGAAICWAAVPIDDAGYWSRDCWKYHGEFCGVECCCTWLGGEVGIGVGAC